MKKGGILNPAICSLLAELGHSDEMLIVTQVAPYADGPAGVHGVLGQVATALGQVLAWPPVGATVVRGVVHRAAAQGQEQAQRDGHTGE